MYALPEHFQAKSRHLATRKMRPNKHSIFKPSRVTWRLGKCDQTNTLFSSQVASLGDSENATKQTLYFQAKWRHLVTRKMCHRGAVAKAILSLLSPDGS